MGPQAARATIAATRDDDDYDDETFGYGDPQGWSEGEDWRDYEDQAFRVYDESGALLDVDVSLPARRVEAEREDALTASFAWRRPITPDLARLAAKSGTMNWTAVTPFDEDFATWREFLCDVLRGARFTLPLEALRFDRSAPPPPRRAGRGRPAPLRASPHVHRSRAAQPSRPGSQAHRRRRVGWVSN